MAQFQPEIIRAYAHRLYARAALSMVTSTILGGLIGLVVAPYLLQSLPVAVSLRCPEWGVVVFLAFLGGLQGWERAFLLKLQAQTALCQLQIELTTRALNAGGDPAASGKCKSL